MFTLVKKLKANFIMIKHTADCFNEQFKNFLNIETNAILIIVMAYAARQEDLTQNEKPIYILF